MWTGLAIEDYQPFQSQGIRGYLNGVSPVLIFVLDPNGVKIQFVAIYFAQHYAESSANPDMEAWKSIVEYYGEEKAEAILAYIKVIMMGNIYGLAAGSFLDHFKGVQVNKKSTIGLELSIILSVIVLFLFFLLKKG